MPMTLIEPDPSIQLPESFIDRMVEEHNAMVRSPEGRKRLDYILRVAQGRLTPEEQVEHDAIKQAIQRRIVRSRTSTTS